MRILIEEKASSEPQHTENVRCEEDEIDFKNLNLESYCLGDSPFSRLMNSSDPNVIISTDDFIYSMDYNKIGRCFIFNHTAYDPKLQLLGRSSGDPDAKRLYDLFYERGFHVEIFKNHTYDEIMNELHLVNRAGFDDYGCFVCCIMTHGSYNRKMYAYDKEYNLNDVLSFFCSDKCPSLAMKPKIFIIQACRGKDPNVGYKASFRESSDGGNTEKADSGNFENLGYISRPIPSLPVYSDFLTAYSTYDGFYAFKTPCASYFILSFCEALKNNYKELDLVSILTLVNHEIAYKFQSRSKEASENKLKQMPCFDSSLTKLVKFS